jgi:hypothetical protein
MATPPLLVCALCYGDHPELAERVLGSIVGSLPAGLDAELRVGCNRVSAATAAVIARWLSRAPVPAATFAEPAGRNVGKYPLARRLLYGPDQTVLPPRDVSPGALVMWFDDDSFVTGGAAFWPRALHAIRDADLVGVPYYYVNRGQGLDRGQRTAIARQPWFAGTALPPKHPVRFPQGGWWLGRLDFLARWNYPFPALFHNGGDVLLGELLRQRGRFADHHWGVVTNADALGRESKARRRGLDTRPLWSDSAPATDERALHDFRVVVTRYGAETGHPPATQPPRTSCGAEDQVHHQAL